MLKTRLLITKPESNSAAIRATKLREYQKKRDPDTITAQL